MFPLTTHNFEGAAKRASEAIQETNLEIFCGGHLPSSAGTYVLRAHLEQMKERTVDIQLILERLQDDCLELNRFDQALHESSWKPEHHPHQHQPDVLKLLAKIEKQQKIVSLGVEAIYQTGAILLDQMAFACCYIFGIDPAVEFAKLITEVMEDPGGKKYNGDLSNAIFMPQQEQLLQLFIHFRTYRNKFIVHHTYPWHRGTYRNYQGDYRIMTSLADGWIDQAKIDADKLYWQGLKGDRHFNDVVETFWQLPVSDRKKVVEIGSRHGFYSMSYADLGFMLLQTVEKTSKLLKAEAASNFSRINLRKSE
jgi:hypothetical protein